jgi:glycosyltransferase involved in cell wall biosynthesis
MNLQKVTIGIPFYNAEKYLADAIKSVINQSYENWNLILLNDGSNDSSLEIAQSFVSDKISVVSDGENKGLVYRLNELTDLSDGAYYARMDADDIMHFQRLEKQLALLQRDLSLDVVGSSYFAIDDNNQIIGLWEAKFKPENAVDILRNGCFAHPSVTGRLEWFKNNKYDGNWERMEDLELWLRTFSNSKFRNIDEPLLFYRVFGMPVISKYVKSNLGIIKLLQKREKYKITFFNSLSFTVFYFIKIVIYTVLNFVGKVDLILKNRFIILDEFKENQAKVSMEQSISKEDI